MGKTLVVAAVVIGVAIVLAVLIITVKRYVEGPSVRRRELRLAQARLTDQTRVISEIEDATRKWSDVDSVLATEIRTIINANRTVVK